MKIQLVSLGALALVACGPGVSSKDDVAGALAHASIPSTQAQSAQAGYNREAAAALGAGITIHGSHGGDATVEINPIELAVGLAGGGLMLDVGYSDYSEDGVVRLGGDLSMLARFQYVDTSGQAPYADLSLSIVGKLELSGAYNDTLHADVTLLTRIHDLEARDGSIELHLSGKIDSNDHHFEFNDEDITHLWQ